MAVKIDPHSRLNFVDLLVIDTVEYWDMAVLPEVPVQTDDIQYDVQDLDRIDRLASRFYGDPVLWWVIAIGNNWDLVPTALSIGDRIRIPSPRFVRQNLFSSVKQVR